LLNEHQAADDGSSPVDVRAGWLLAGVFVSISAVGALLYFLGHARVQSMHVTLGIPAGKIRSSQVDYITSGVDVVLPFLVLVAVPALVLMWAHRKFVVRYLAMPRYSRANKVTRRVLECVSVVAALCLGVVALGILCEETVGHPLGILLPLALSSGGAALAYRLHVPKRARDNVNRVATLLLVLLSVFGVLWTASLYGGATGVRYARHFKDNAAEQADIMILSRTPLNVGGPGVTVEHRPQERETGGYEYCYRGLRYLMESDSYLVVAPVGWRPTVDPLSLIPVDADMRFDTKPAEDVLRELTCSQRV
jgi:hypothetical protein